ncbi:hypothetical protein L7F22_013666 [Adiantum nelumboides]|nr:hypothetical protein [Adiantum nelumboides]
MAASALVLGTTPDAPRPVTWTYELTEEDEVEMQTAMGYCDSRLELSGWLLLECGRLDQCLRCHAFGHHARTCPRQPQFENNDGDWEEKKHEAQLVWSQIFVRLLAQWAQFFAALFGRASWPGSLLFWGAQRQSESQEQSDDLELTPLQEERLGTLQGRIEVPFDGTYLWHQDALRELWAASFPDRQLIDLVSEQWKDMGWQGKDPSTDFRGGGFISLENLLFFAKEYPRSFHKLLHKEEGCRATWEYPFAVAGINISFMLLQFLELRSAKPKTLSGRQFVKLLEEDEFAFDRLYCVAFEMMDAQWLAMKASYMEFNVVLKATQAQLEREMSLDDVTRVQDLPAFNLLRHN